MRTFIITSPGRQIKYLGWDRRMSPLPGHIVLLQDEDSVDILALDTPPILDGVLEYIEDNPCMTLLGVYKLMRKPTITVIPDDQLASWLGVSDSRGRVVNNFLASHLSQVEYDELIEILK